MVHEQLLASLYGGNVAGQEITGGVDLSDDAPALADILSRNGYSAAHSASVVIGNGQITGQSSADLVASGIAGATVDMGDKDTLISIWANRKRKLFDGIQTIGQHNSRCQHFGHSIDTIRKLDEGAPSAG